MLLYCVYDEQEREWVVIDKTLNPAVWTMYKGEAITANKPTLSKNTSITAAQPLQATTSTGNITSQLLCK
jgi:hypothetical protein